MIATHKLWLLWPENARRLENRNEQGAPPCFVPGPDLRAKRLPIAGVFDPGHINAVIFSLPIDLLSQPYATVSPIFPDHSP
jgi:hypothetical protein